MKQISIIGFGRFGRTLYELLKEDFSVVLYNRSGIDPSVIVNDKNTTIAQNLSQVYASDIIFYAVPISEFENVILTHKGYINPVHTLIDVLSVKLYPQEIFNKYITNKDVEILLTHPMFGPDSVVNGFAGLPIVLDKFRTNQTTYMYWKTYFSNKTLKVIELQAKIHDEIAANSQGLTHFIGRLLDEYTISPTQMDSLGTIKLLEIKEQTCNDSWQLFTDLQHYNPYTKSMRLRLGSSYDRLYNKLLPKRVAKGTLTFGIQGGKGSFNEEALYYYLKRNDISKYDIKYLYTANSVLEQLHEGKIDRGQIAIHNSVGGIVEESIYAMSKYKFKIVDEFAINISHAIMIRDDADFTDVTKVMSHPQVFAQCRQTLARKYPQLSLSSGKGKLIDHSAVAKELSEHKLPKTVATMGSKILANIYNLKIVEDNLQDVKDNYTSFLQIERI